MALHTTTITLMEPPCWQADTSCSSCSLTLANHPANATIIFPPLEGSVLGVAAITFTLLGTLANLLLLASLLLDDRVRSKPTTPFILSVCTSDLLFSLVITLIHGGVKN